MDLDEALTDLSRRWRDRCLMDDPGPRQQCRPPSVVTPALARHELRSLGWEADVSRDGCRLVVDLATVRRVDEAQTTKAPAGEGGG